MTHSIAVFALLQWRGTKTTVSPRYAYRCQDKKYITRDKEGRFTMTETKVNKNRKIKERKKTHYENRNQERAEVIMRILEKNRSYVKIYY